MGAEQSLEQADPAGASPFSRLLPKTGPGATAGAISRSDGVVVVSGPNSMPSSGLGQSELDKLAKIPIFSPFIKSSVNLFGFDSNSIDGSSSSSLSASASPSSGMGQSAPMLDSRALASISTRLQEHLRQCAEAVAFDQNALCNRMSEVDLSIAAAHSCLSERHRRYTRLTEQLSQTKDMCALATKVRAGVEQTHRGLLELNNFLPPDLRIAIPEMPVQQSQSEGNRSRASSQAPSNSNSVELPKKSIFEALASSASSSTSSHLHQTDVVTERPCTAEDDPNDDSGNASNEQDGQPQADATVES